MEYCSLAFFGRQLRPAERKYSTFDQELLALYLAICHFRYFVKGRDFTAFTDHKPLTFAFAKVSKSWSAHQQCHLTSISEYTTYIKHIAGKSNHVADALSRMAINAVHSSGTRIDFTAMAAAQQSDDKIESYRSTDLGLVIQDIQFGPCNNSLLCDISTRQPRPIIVPASFHRKVFGTIHCLSHPSIRATQKLITDRGLTCIACQEAKVQQHIRGPLQPFSAIRSYPHRHCGPPPTITRLYSPTHYHWYTRWPP